MATPYPGPLRFSTHREIPGNPSWRESMAPPCRCGPTRRGFCLRGDWTIMTTPLEFGRVWSANPGGAGQLDTTSTIRQIAGQTREPRAELICFIGSPAGSDLKTPAKGSQRQPDSMPRVELTCFVRWPCKVWGPLRKAPRGQFTLKMCSGFHIELVSQGRYVTICTDKNS